MLGIHGGEDQIEVFWIVTPCVVIGYQRFGGPYCLNLQGCSRLSTFRNHVTSTEPHHYTVTTQRTMT